VFVCVCVFECVLSSFSSCFFASLLCCTFCTLTIKLQSLCTILLYSALLRVRLLSHVFIFFNSFMSPFHLHLILTMANYFSLNIKKQNTDNYRLILEVGRLLDIFKAPVRYISFAMTTAIDIYGNSSCISCA